MLFSQCILRVVNNKIYIKVCSRKHRDKIMSDLPEKQVKRLKSLIQEAETSLAAAKELIVS